MPSFWKAAADAFAPVFKPSGTLIEGVNSGSWASPEQPIRPTTQLAVGVRTWDFAPGKNLQFTPRGDVAITFGQLWNCSNSFDLCRIAIEMRKNQIVNRPWLIRVKEMPGEKKKERLAREANTPNVAKVQDLLRYPDGYHPFDKWIRMWVEQLLVFDAPCVYPVRNMLGDIFQLRIVSGATITPLIDQQGFIPLPPSPAFQQIILGIPTSNLQAAGSDKQIKQKLEYTTDQLFYAPMNPRVDSRWGFGPVEQIITTLSIASNRQRFLSDYYTSGNIPEGLLNMPENWGMQQIKDFQNWFDSMLAGNLNKKRRLMMVPGGGKAAGAVQFSKTEALTDNTDEYLIRVVFGCFGLSPSAYVRQVGHQSTNKEGNDMAQEQGLEPILAHIEVEMNRIIERGLGADDVEFAFADAEEVDPLKKSQVDVAYINAGVYTRDERREANGDDPLGVPEGSIPGITTMQGFVPLDQPVQQAGGGQEPDDPEQPPKNQARSKVRKSSLKIVGGNLTPRSRQAQQEASRMLGRFLKDQAARVARTARQKFAARKVRKDDLQSDTDRALVILGSIEWDYPTLYASIRPYLEIAAEQGAHEGAIQMAANRGASLNETLTEGTAAAKTAAKNRAAEMVGLEIQDDGTVAEATGAHWAISTTAKDDVLNAIKQAIKETWTPDQLEAVIQASTIFSQDHAEMTASNEIDRQQAYGHLLSWRASGQVLEYRWTVADAGCCPLCASFALQGSVPIDHNFGDGIFAPGAHPECRCWLTATKFKGEE